MIDRQLVTSGFDAETVVSEEFVTYLLLAQIDAGLLPLSFPVFDPVDGINLDVTLHPPVDYQRLYVPDPSAPVPEAAFGSFIVELLPADADAFLKLTIMVTVVDNSVDPPGVFGPLPMGALIDLELTSDPRNGFQRNHQLAIRFNRFDDITLLLLEGAGVDVDALTEEVRDILDREVPLGVARGQVVQRIEMRRFVTNDRRSLGFYVDLALRSGPQPTSFHEPRGDVDLAQDFRPDGAPIAFSTSPGLFALLGPDLKNRQAEESAPGSGNYRFPIREDMDDPDSDSIGRIKGIRIGPEISITPPGLTGRLLVDIHAEYTDALGDPDFHLKITFDPLIDGGLVTFDIDVDVDFGLLATLLLIAAGIGLTILFAPAGIGWGATIVAGGILGAAVLKELIAEPLAARLIEERLDTESQASFLDALPFRVPAARRRWDPFYVTDHQVVALVDDVVIDQFGIMFEGTGLRLDKQPEPLTDTIIRDEERSGGSVTALRFRVASFADHVEDFVAAAPGTDRMAFDRSEPDIEPTLVSLTDAQIAERRAIGRIRGSIGYTPEQIHLVANQIDQLLCLSQLERDELRDRLIDDFRDETKQTIADDEGDNIRAQVIVDLTAELGRPPTDVEIDDAVDDALNARVRELEPSFEENELPGLLEGAVARTLRFDLAPEEFVARQRAGVLVVVGKDIIVLQREDGTETPYYRDRADGNPADNLLSLPRYSPPYTPSEDL